MKYTNIFPVRGGKTLCPINSKNYSLSNPDGNYSLDSVKAWLDKCTQKISRKKTTQKHKTFHFLPFKEHYIYRI